VSDELVQLDLDAETEMLAALEQGFDGWDIFKRPATDDDEDQPA
jgi:hypothetical protein